MLQSGRPLFSDITLNTQRHESIFATTTGVSRRCSVAIRGGCRRSLAISSESIVWLWIFLFIILVESPCYLRALRGRGLRPASLVRAVSRWSLREATGQLTAVGCDSRDVSTASLVAVWVVRGLAGLLSGVSRPGSPLGSPVDALDCLLGFTRTTEEHVLKLPGVIGRVCIVGGDGDGFAAFVGSLVLFNIGFVLLRNRWFNILYFVSMRNNLPCWSTCCSVHHSAIFLAWHSRAWYWIFIIVCLIHSRVSFDPSWIVDVITSWCFWL